MYARWIGSSLPSTAVVVEAKTQGKHRKLRTRALIKGHLINYLNYPDLACATVPTLSPKGR